MLKLKCARCEDLLGDEGRAGRLGRSLAFVMFPILVALDVLLLTVTTRTAVGIEHTIARMLDLQELRRGAESTNMVTGQQSRQQH